MTDVSNIDDSIQTLSQAGLNLLERYCNCVDELWIKRKRSINTFQLYKSIAFCCLSKFSFQTARNMNVFDFSPSAIHQARARMHINLFELIYKQMYKDYVFNDVDEGRVMAIDGSKVHLPRSAVADGYRPMQLRGERPVGW